MSNGNIEVVPARRIDTMVQDGMGTTMWRSDYAGTVWYGGRAQPGGLVMSRGMAQISSPFWLPDSLRYSTTDDVQLQASAAVQSVFENCQILDVQAELGDPSGAGGARIIYVTISATAKVPVGVSYRIVALAPKDAVEVPG